MNTEQKLARLMELTEEIATLKAQVTARMDEVRVLLGAQPSLPTSPAADEDEGGRSVPSSRPPLTAGERCDNDWLPFTRALRRASDRELKEEIRRAFLANSNKRLSLETLAKMLKRDRMKILVRLNYLTRTDFLSHSRAFAPTSNRTVDCWMLKDPNAGQGQGLPRTVEPEKPKVKRPKSVSAPSYEKIREAVLAALTHENRKLAMREMNLPYAKSTQFYALARMVEEKLITATLVTNPQGLSTRYYQLVK